MNKIIWSVLIALIFSTTTYAQSIKINVSGTVTDVNTHEPLPGVNIQIEGTFKGTVTDYDGKFEIAVNQGDNLIFSFLGYKRQIIPAEPDMSVEMEEDIQGFEEVVVVGYGSTKKQDLTGSIVQISSEDIVRQSASNATQAIQGKVSGVLITASEVPGSSPSVIIRGLGTVQSGRNPLYVVDGVPVDNIDNISPNDIVQYDLLKDASSLAIYGNRAANGVIVITTKQGKKGKMKVAVDSYVGFKEILNTVEMADAEGFINYSNAAYIADYPNGRFAPASSQPYDTDWYDELVQTGSVSNHTISIAGGSDDINYFFSVNRFDEEGLLDGQKYERTNIRNNNDYILTDRLKLVQSLSISVSKNKPKPLSAFNYAYRQSPLVPVKYENGAWGGSYLNRNSRIATYEGNPGDIIDQYNNVGNPVAAVYFHHEDQENITAQGRLSAEYSLTDYLSLTTRIGGTKQYYNSENYNPTMEEWIAAYPTRTVDEYNALREGSIDEYHYNSLYKVKSEVSNWNWDTFFSFDDTFSSDHHVKSTLGMALEEYGIGNTMSGRAYDVPFDSDYWSIRFSENQALDEADQVDYTPSRVSSFFGRVEYSYKSKYLVNATVRRDGSSKFQSGNRWGTFPSFGLGWIVSEESFMPETNWLDFLKIRGGWGRLGNQNISQNVVTITDTDYILGASQEYVSGSSINAILQEDLSWEKIEELTIATDFILVKNLMGTVEYYNKKTTNSILSITPIMTTGKTTASNTHIGEISNTGFEFLLNWNNTFDLAGKEFSYSIGANLSTNKNELTKLTSDSQMNIMGGSLSNGQVTKKLAVDEPLGSFWLYEFTGIDAEGNAIYKDANNDGAIDDLDRGYFGSYIPKYHYGINIQLSYVNFDFNIDGYGVGGNKVYDGLAAQRWGGENITKDVADNYWSLLSPSDSYIKPSNEVPLASTYYLHKGDYFRINNITLGYSFSDFLEGIEQLRLYVTAQNPFMFTDYDGFTPELIGDGDPMGTMGMELNAYPTTRTFLFGINLKF